MLSRLFYKTPDVWNDFYRMNQNLERLFGSGNRELFSFNSSGVFPAFNIYDEGDNLVISAEIPGIDVKELDISATGNSLTVKGERKAPLVDEKASFHRQERGHGVFSRTISLPLDIDADKVDAEYKLGVLKITLPKAKEARPRKIEIKA
ncbi:MAG: Hsp20/alpha crystallin family protein [Deltaproteobacteria bacterium]|nr:Hsp20/alpha crystallin family protein [Deltaproteobacteria bacterium]